MEFATIATQEEKDTQTATAVVIGEDGYLYNANEDADARTVEEWQAAELAEAIEASNATPTARQLKDSDDPYQMLHNHFARYIANDDYVNAYYEATRVARRLLLAMRTGNPDITIED